MMWQLPVHNVRFAGTIVGGAVGIDARPIEAGHEQDRQLAADHMQFRRPEAAGHRTIFAIEIAACEQIDLLGPSTRGVGKRFDGVGDAQRHMGSTVVRIHAIAVGASVAMNMNIGLPLKSHANTDGSARSTANGTG